MSLFIKDKGEVVDKRTSLLDKLETDPETPVSTS